MTERTFFIDESDEMTRAVISEDGRVVEYHSEDDGILKEGSIILGRVSEHASSLDAWFIDVGENQKAYLPTRNTYGRNIRQNTLLPLQVLHPERGGKGMTVSCRLMVSGRYSVCGNTGDKIRISSKLDGADERKRLRVLSETYADRGREIVIRTLAGQAEDEEIANDILDNLRILDEIESAQGSPGKVLYRPESIIESLMRTFDPQDDKAYFNRIETFNEYFDSYRITNSNRGIKHYSHEYGMFDFFGISGEIKKAGLGRIMMKSGAVLVFDNTEAMTVIDVNTAGNSVRNSLEETALATNLEAAKEIAIQIRLRNISGIIIIDFIETDQTGMDETDRCFRQWLKRDPRKMTIGGYTKLANYELIRSRKGRKPDFGK